MINFAAIGWSEYFGTSVLMAHFEILDKLHVVYKLLTQLFWLINSQQIYKLYAHPGCIYISYIYIRNINSLKTTNYKQSSSNR